MEIHASLKGSYYLLVSRDSESDLAAIRTWNLEMAYEDDHIWVRNFDDDQIQSKQVQCIPYKLLFYENGGKLFLLNSRLPDGEMPALTWTHIRQVLTIQLPRFNHHLFGIHQRLAIKLSPCNDTQEVAGMLTSLATLGRYVETAPAIRLKPLSWAIVENDSAFVFGVPLLPVEGNVFWRSGDFFIPAGSQFEYPILEETIHRMLNPDANSWIVWNPGSSYFLIDKADLRPLTISSFRLSFSGLNQ